MPDGYREGSFASARAGWRTIFRIVPLPTAIPGILAGVILSPSAASSATAALIYTAGTYAQTADSLFPRCARCRYTCMCSPARVAHRSGLRHGGGAADRGGRHQRPVCGRGQEHCKEEADMLKFDIKTSICTTVPSTPSRTSPRRGAQRHHRPHRPLGLRQKYAAQKRSTA